MKNFMDTYNVSRETFDRLKTYEASLFEWQKNPAGKKPKNA